MENDNAKFKVSESIVKHSGFSLIIIVLAVLAVAAVAFGVKNWKWQVEQI